MEWYEKIIEEAKSNLRKSESLIPVFFLKKNDRLAIFDLTKLNEKKDFMVFILKQMVEELNPDEYLLLMEAWIQEAKAKEDSSIVQLLDNGVLSVGQLPSSKDCISILHGDRSKEKVGFIVFEKQGKKVVFQPINWIADAEVQGRFTHLRES